MWKGLRPGATTLRAPSSSLKLDPRFCHWMPVSSSTTPEPNSQYTLWMKLTARPSPSTAPIHTVSPALGGRGHSIAQAGSIAAAAASSASGARNRSGGLRMYAGSVISRSRTMNASFVASTSPCRCANPSASVTPRRSKMPRIMSDARPWVGGGKLYAAPGRSASRRGAFTCARWRSRSPARTGLPARARSAAIVPASGPR